MQWSRNLVARLGLVALLSTGLGGVSSVYAQGSKSTDAECKKNPNNPGCKKETKKETKIEAVKRTETKAPKKEDKGPRISSITIHDEAWAAAAAGKRKEALGYLEELIKSTPKGDPELPELLYQYGEVLYDQSKSAYLSARALDDKLYEARQKKDKAAEAEIKKKQKKFEETANKNRLEAFKAYINIIDNYPSYPKRDEVLFYTGFNLKELAQQYRTTAEDLRFQGQEDEAESLEAKAASYEDKTRDFYKTLIKEYPNSRFVPDSLLEFAEYYFYDNDMTNALRAYQKLASYPESRVYGYSIYMQGWCYFNMGDYQAALKKFVEVVQYSREKLATSGDKGNVTLEKEGLRDIVRTYSKFGTPQKAKSFFQKIGGPDKYKEMMAQLGGFYYEQGAFLDSIEIYEEVIAIEPNSNDNYQYQYEICNAALALATQNQPGAQERIVTEMQTLSKIYQDMVARKAPADKIKEAKTLTAQILKEVATTWHATAQKTQDKGLYDRAQYIYKEYLTSFPDAEDAYVMTWNYAELLFQLGDRGDDTKWEEAANMYQRVVEMDPKGKYLQEAAFASVVAYQNATRGMLKYSAPPDTPAEGSEPDLSPKPIPEREQRMIKAYEFYMQYAPTGEKIVACKFEAARIYYEYNHFDKAEPVFKSIVDNHSADPLAGYAANLLLDILRIRKKTEDFKAYVFKFKEDPNLSQNPELQDILVGLVTKFRSDECRDAEKNKLWSQAAACYANLVQDEDLTLTEEDRAGAVYNAAVCYENAKQIGMAIQYRQKMVDEFGNTENGQKSVFALGRLYMNIAVYGRAADYFEEFANKFPGNEDAIPALNNAAIFREGLGEYDAAVENNKKYITVAKRQKVSDQEIADAFFRIAKIREKEGNAAKTFAAYEEYLKLYGKKGKPDNWLAAKTWTASHLWKDKKKRPEALKRCNEVVKAVAEMGEEAKNLTFGLDAAAECAFYIAENEYEVFENFKLPNDYDEKKLQAWYEGVKKAREDASALYLKVKDYGSKGWTLAAFARIGLMSYKFMDGLYNAPLPEVLTVPGYGKIRLKGALKEEIEDKVRSELDVLAEPIRTDAITAFKICVDGATQNNWYNEWSALCEEYLNKMEPSTYPLSAEWKAEPIYEKPIIAPASVIKQLR